MERETTIPPRTEALVDGMMVYRTFEPLSGTLMTESAEIKPKVRIARELLPDRNRSIPVRVINMSDDEILLSRGIVLSEVQPVENFEPQLDVSEEFGHLNVVLETVDSELSLAQRASLETLLRKHASTFSKDEMDFGKAIGVKHSIDTNNHRPVKQALRRQPEKYLTEIDNQVETMLKQGIMKPAQSAWSSNVVMARKKDGSLRFCVDYRKLNEPTLKDIYPLPLIQSCLDAVGKTKLFSTFDLRSGYHQMVMDQKDADKTTFVTRRGTYRFTVMPFGLCNAPATFQRLMNVAMPGLNFDMSCVPQRYYSVLGHGGTAYRAPRTTFSALGQDEPEAQAKQMQIIPKGSSFLGTSIVSRWVDDGSREDKNRTGMAYFKKSQRD